MAHKPKTLSYSEAVCVFNDDAFVSDLKESFQILGQSMLALLHSFDSISSQLHTFDLQGMTTQLRPKWRGLHKEFADVVLQFRTNAGLISGRLRMFSDTVLPLTVRILTGHRGAVETQDEILQVLESFMTLSAEHARLSYPLAENVVRLTSTLNSFHTEFSKYASSKSSTPHQDVQQLCHKFAELEGIVKRLYYAIGKLTGGDVTLMAFSSLRLVATVRKRAPRARLSQTQLAFPGTSLASIASLYQQLERTENEKTHIHYTVQMAHRRTDLITMVRTAMSSLVSNEITTFETGLTFLLTLWSRLQTDCLQLNKWLSESCHQEIPACVLAYAESQKTFYRPLSDCLNIFSAEIDQSLAKIRATP